MGKTKIKTIDDSAPGVEAKKPKDTLVAKLLEELGEVEAKPKEKEEKKAEEKKVEEKKPSVIKKAKAVPAGRQVKPRGKKYQEASAQVEKDKRYPLDEALDLVKKTSYSKFEGSVEAHINTNVKNIRGLVSLPFVSGKKLTILAFPPSSKTSEGLVAKLQEEGVIIGDDQTISEIEKGKMNFDVLVTTPEWMSKLVKIAKVLGPRGLMPNPKNGTITDDLEKTIKELQSGKVEYKTEKDGQVIHLLIGKVNQDAGEIASNIKTLYSIIGKSKIKKITLSPTMGPGIKVDLGSI